MAFERIWHKSYSAGVPTEIHFDRISMPEVLTRTAQRFPDVTALIYMGKKISYATLDSLVNRFAKALTAIGVKKGDTVAMLLPNIPRWSLQTMPPGELALWLHRTTRFIPSGNLPTNWMTQTPVCSLRWTSFYQRHSR